MSALTDLLDQLRALSLSERDKGDKFEVLCRTALRTDRTYAERFSNVWLWMDWPDRPTGEPDIGIDLVAEHRDGSGHSAIQCKFYAPETPLAKEDIDSFFTASGRAPFTERIIISTTDMWTTNAEKSLKGQGIPVTRIGIDDLEAMTIDWSTVIPTNLAKARIEPVKTLKPHQQTAVDKVRAGFGETDRGKLVMACGTGKTFTALKIAEEHAGPGSTVLFLAPSIALVSQSLKEWTAETTVPIRPFAICSDATAGKHIDGETASEYDLPIPATTDPVALAAAGAGDTDLDRMTVVFSTYQSIQIVADLQASTGLEFDLIVCDEAHRTTGASEDGDESAFVKVHDNTLIPAARRLYMTATPKIYKPAAKEDATDKDLVFASMDDVELYGPEFWRLGFGEAVTQGLLADYRVLILNVEETAVSESFQSLLSQHGELALPDVAKFVGCVSALSKLDPRNDTFVSHPNPMQRAVAFWGTIADSQRFADTFDDVADHYNSTLNTDDEAEGSVVSVPTRHVDGTTNIRARRSDIRWIKDPVPEGECRILTNARCLTEGVDVPALDAVMFMTARNSHIDIVQAVGRVMRKPHGKTMGYIILPVAVPAGKSPAEALSSNEYDKVWDVLQALRSHDERFNSYVNRIALRETNEPDDDDPIVIIKPPVGPADPPGSTESEQLQFAYEEWAGAIYTKIVKKVGSRTYWEDWASDVADIAARQEARINSILSRNADAQEAFDRFLTGLHHILNNSITASDAVSMLSQHLITKPIFQALFTSTDFAISNPVSIAMQQMVDVLETHNLDTETETLDEFYDSVRQRVEGISDSDAYAKQSIIKDLYGRFFKTAFPKVADSLGIVYTPLEVVDFIIAATQAALIEHFDLDLSSQGVHVLDPFTGTGTFVTRLLQSGYIKPDDLVRKYNEEVHANEILLLAYYIAAINIETTYQQALLGAGFEGAYKPFPGIVYTDTFQLNEAGNGTGTMDVFPINNQRADAQRKLDIQVIMGNPPYSAGQDSTNDNNPNLSYPSLDASITATYASRSRAQSSNRLYDSYIRAIRWASNRLSTNGGVIAYVTNGGWIGTNTADGMRLTLAAEFHHVYVFNLRGNQRGDWKREGGKIFAEDSQTAVAIVLLVKQPGPVPAEGAQIRYRDIGEYLSRESKLEILRSGLDRNSPSLAQLTWERVSPNDEGDWIDQRTESFHRHLPTYAENEPSIFEACSNGLKTARDAWNYNSSRAKLEANNARMTKHYNRQVDLFKEAHPTLPGTLPQRAAIAKEFVDLDPKSFSWDGDDFKRLAQGRRYNTGDSLYMTGTYRPFHRRWVNAAPIFNSRTYQLPKMFPATNTDNLTIGAFLPGSPAPFTCMVTNDLPNLTLAGAGNPMQFFPRWLYDVPPVDDQEGRLFNRESHEDIGRRHNVTDHALALYQELDTSISKDDIFYYVYAVLHSNQYRSTFAADLKKVLPRIPRVNNAADFWEFSGAGRNLTDLHSRFEEVEPWHGLELSYAPGFDPDEVSHWYVAQAKHPKISSPGEGRKINDLARIVVNEWVTILNVPAEAYAYTLGTRSAIAWVLESFRVKTHKQSGITNDPNDWGLEHGHPSYIVDTLRSVVTVSMRTVEIVGSLPQLDI